VYIYLYFYIEKARKVTTSPTPLRHAPFPIATSFGMWGQVADVINRANFYQNRFKGAKFALLHWLDVSPLQ